MQQLNSVVGAWNIGLVHEISVPTTGTINQTVLLTTNTGRYVLRAYRPCSRQWVEREHAIIAHARRQHLPAIAPIARPNGATLFEHQQRFYALFGHAPGEQRARDALDTNHIAAMGRCLAQLHHALASFVHPLLQPRAMPVDVETTLSRIAHFEQLIKSAAVPQPSDGYALAWLSGQRHWVQAHRGMDMATLALLPAQPIHGDYTETNLFFDHGGVSAIIDWDQAYLAPRAWEVVRTLDLVFRFAPLASATFLNAYCAHASLALEHLDLAATCYSVMRAHDLWMYAAIYEQQNDRVRQFIDPNGFVDLLAAWQQLKAHLPMNI